MKEANKRIQEKSSLALITLAKIAESAARHPGEPSYE